MDRYKKLLSIVTLSVMVLGLSIVASAQWRDRRGNDDYYGRNNRNLKSTIKNLRNNSRRFEDILDRELDRSRYDGSRREDRLNKLAERFKNAAEDLDDEYEGYRSMRKSSDEARRVVNYGSQLDRALSNSRLSRTSYNLRNYWRNIERDLRIISRAYNINYNGRYGRNNGRYDRNDRYGRNDRRGNNRNSRYNRNLRSTIVNLKNNARRFEDRIDRENDNDRYRRNRYRNNLENLSDRFRNAVNRLEDEYDNNRDYDDSYDEVRRVLSLGEQVDRELSRSRASRSVRNDWSRIERDLRVLANAYNLRYNGRNNRTTRGIGDIIRRFPF